MSEKQLNKWNELTRDHYTRVGERFRMEPSALIGATLLEHVLQQPKGHLNEFSVSGSVAEVEDDPDGSRYVKKIEKLGGRLIHSTVADLTHNVTFLFDHGIVTLYIGGEYISVQGLSSNSKFIVDLQKFFSGEILPTVQQGYIFAIVASNAGLSINSIGYAGVPLVSGNYTRQVLEDYQFITKDMKSSVPSGRITIMEGEPGTGKTHLIRAMLNDIPDAMFVLISPDMVPAIAGPELLPLLTSTKNSYSLNGPIVLVLEDADRCLVRREADNINSIQSLLNLGDGILGSLLDLRIVATTNAKKLEMEAAILRPGRLSKRMEVGSLDFQTARGVFSRLLPNKAFPSVLVDETSKFKMTLAEAYFLAREHGWEPDARPAKKKKRNPSPAYYYDD